MHHHFASLLRDTILHHHASLRPTPCISLWITKSQHQFVLIFFVTTLRYNIGSYCLAVLLCGHHGESPFCITLLLSRKTEGLPSLSVPVQSVSVCKCQHFDASPLSNGLVPFSCRSFYERDTLPTAILAEPKYPVIWRVLRSICIRLNLLTSWSILGS